MQQKKIQKQMEEKNKLRLEKSEKKRAIHFVFWLNKKRDDYLKFLGQKNSFLLLSARNAKRFRTQKKIKTPEPRK